jgi:hypothetical protein
MAPFLRRATHDRNANQYQIAKVLFLQAPLTEGMRPAVSSDEQMPRRLPVTKSGEDICRTVTCRPDQRSF